MAQGDIYEMTLRFGLLGNEVNNVFHFRAEFPTEDNDLQQLADVYNQFVHFQYVDAQPQEMENLGIRVQRITPGNRSGVADYQMADVDRTLSGSLMPTYVCALFRFATGRPGRRASGRFFYAGLLDGQIEANMIVDDNNIIRTAGNSIYDNFGQANDSGQPFRLIVWSPTTIEEGGTASEAASDVISSAMRQKVSVQRRRLTGYGI